MQVPLPIALFVQAMRIRLWWCVLVLVTRVAPTLGVLAIGLVFSFAFFGYSKRDFTTAAIAFAIPTAGFGVVIWIATRRLASFTAPPIVFEALEAQPQLHVELKKVAEEFHSRVPRALAPMLAMQQQALSLDPDRMRDIPLPLGCLDAWSIMELRCHVAHHVIRRRPGFQKIEAQFAFANATIGASGPRVRQIFAQIGRRCSQAGQSWYLLANMEADRRVAKVYGAGLVASWVEKMWLAESFMPFFLNSFVNPMLKRKAYLPVTEACASLQRLFATQWDAILKSNQPNAYRTRLEALRALPSGSSAFDSRPALSILVDFPSLEERVLRVESKQSLGAPLHRLELTDYCEMVVLPDLREELGRNQQLFDGNKLEDLPALAQQVTQLATRVISPPGMLFDAKQREAVVPHLLVAFLSINLIDRGWQINRESWSAFVLQHEDRKISPHQVVQGLISKTLPAADFEKFVTSTPHSTQASPTD